MGDSLAILRAMLGDGASDGPRPSSGHKRVCAVTVLALGSIALLALTSDGPTSQTQTQSLLTAKNAAKMSAHATYDSERVTYQAQQRAMRHLKGEFIKANADLSTFFTQAVKQVRHYTRHYDERAGPGEAHGRYAYPQRQIEAHEHGICARE